MKDITQFADHALLNMFKQLKLNYQQATQNDMIEPPDIPSWPE